MPLPRYVWGAAAAGLAVGVIAALGARAGRREGASRPGAGAGGGGGGSGTLPPGTPKPRTVAGVAFAQGGKAPVWPIVTAHPNAGVVSYEDVGGEIHGNAARRFGATREGRRHAGVDLYGYEGDRVIATEPGIVVNSYGFHLGTDALVVAHDSGIVVVYGEIDRASGIGKNHRVAAGQTLGRIGCMVHEDGGCKSHMLHFETYRVGETKNHPWYTSEGVPPSLLDPSAYLLRASSRAPVAASLPHRLRRVVDEEWIPPED